MPVDLTIVESTTELGQTVVEVVLESASAPGPTGPGVAAGGTAGQVLTKDSGTDFDTSWQDASGGGVTDADYLVGTAHAGLSAEIVVGTSPGGELGGTWASPTVDATHSGSSHAGVQAAAEATAAAALAAHVAADVIDGDTAGGVLSGTYPNPGFAADMATQAELDAHVTDATAAHAASAISFTPQGSIAATDVQAAIQEVRDEAGGGGAPTDVDYLVGTASGGLSAEIVVGTTPGGELGGTWASPTVDATHSGSSHAGVQAAAEATAAAALATHEADTTSVHGIADTSALALTANVVTKALYDANTVLAADSDNTPAALTMGASTILARLAAGNIKAASVAEILALLDVPTNAQAILDAIVDAKGDLIVGTAADTVARKAVGATNGMHLEAQSGQSDGLLWALPPGYEFEYQEITAPVTISATTAATASTCITADAVVLDGSTKICIEVMSPQVQTGTTANSEILTAIWDAVDGGAAADLGRIHYLGRGDGTRAGFSGLLERYFLTPAAGSHVFSVRAYRTNANGTFGAGTGGADTNVPAYIRITKA